MIVIKKNDGSVFIMHLMGGQKNIQAEIDKWPLEQRNAVVSWREMPDEVIPSDRIYRDAWCDETADHVVDIDMPKAKEIHRVVLRSLREPKFSKIEREQRTALSNGDAKAAARAEQKLQALRDVTSDPAIEAATTLEELKSVIPEALK